jgi:transposase-like protein
MNRLSPDRIEALVRWLKRGLSVRSIAAVAEVNRNTVLRYKKAIERGEKVIPDPSEDRRSPSAKVYVRASRETLDRLEDIADQLNSSREEIASVILETVARDDLFGAVLDLKS